MRNQLLEALLLDIEEDEELDDIDELELLGAVYVFWYLMRFLPEESSMFLPAFSMRRRLTFFVIAAELALLRVFFCIIIALALARMCIWIAKRPPFMLAEASVCADIDMADTEVAESMAADSAAMRIRERTMEKGGRGNVSAV